MAETPGNPNIETGGGAFVGGSASAGHDFVGGNQTNITNNNIVQPPEEKIDGRPCIPNPPSDFVGREAELDALCQSVTKGAIITGLHGLGGIGKTALALKAAERLQPNYPDGGIYLDLHGPDPNPLTSEQALEHVIRVYYRAAQLPERLEDLKIAYTQALSGKKLLLLLDNARDRAQVAPLLDVLPKDCLALVTSRTRFTYPGMVDQHLDVLPEDKAVELLLEIAPGIGEKAAALAAVCGYLPLALRVVASQLHDQVNLTPQDALDFMQDATTRLEMTTADASLELSYQMLPEPLREHWRKLAVFAGDFDENAVAWVWGLITNETSQEEDQRSRRKVKQTLGDLITYSLVEYKDSRYRLHDLARLFAVGKMDMEEDHAARLIHANYYYQLLWQCDRLYKKGNENVAAGLALFDRERREISAGWAWAADSLKDAADNQAADHAKRLWLCCDYPDAGAYPLSLCLHPREQIRWLEQALTAARLLNNRQVESYHLNSLGNAYADLGEVQRAIGYYEQRLVIAREIGDRRGEGSALNNLGIAYADLGEVQRAIGYYEQRLVIARDIGDQRGESIVCWNLGLVREEQGDLAGAVELMQVCVDYERSLGHPDAEEDAARVGEIRARMAKGE